MKKKAKTIEFKFERTIPASPEQAFNGWLNPKIPGNPWNPADKLIFNPKVDTCFYWNFHGTPHFGRFTKVAKPSRVQHTWMSPSTLGQESTVTVTFKKQGKETLMTLVHTNLPDEEAARGHERGWNYFLDIFMEKFTTSKK